MRSSLICLALLAAACATPAGAQSQQSPSWMSGYWLSCEGGRETAENWIGAETQMLLGTNLSGRAFEFLRIAPNAQGGFSYYAMPGGRAPATEFAMTAHAGQRVTFENPAHDFPQRIIYEREGDTLIARVEGPGRDGRTASMQWRFQRAEPDARCAG